MTIVRCMFVAQGRSMSPEDTFVNTFYFDGGINSYDTTCDAVLGFLPSVWNTVSAGSSVPLGGYYSRFINPNATTLRFYDMSEAKPRTPRIEPIFMQSGGVSSEDLPEEVAVCVSFRGDPPYTARRRGRCYLGPLNASAIAIDPEPGTSPSRPSTTFMTCAKNAFARLQSDAALTNNDWVIQSVTPSPNYVPITSGWVDNAWDTQRRRGVDPTSRVVWPNPA